MHDGDRALETPLGGFDDFGVAYLLRCGLKFAEARGNNLGDVAFLVALRDGDRFIQLAILERTSDLLYKHTRLLARRAVHQGAVDHDADGINREKKKNNNNSEGEPSHMSKHAADVPANSVLKHHCCVQSG